MRSSFIALVLLAAAVSGCGKVQDRAECSASSDCPAGQYCARTGDGNVCWADPVAPSVSAVSAACLQPLAGGACARDGALRVSATLTDDVELLGATVDLGLGGAPVALARTTGDVWGATVQLGALPFPVFEADLVATVVVQDGARNAALAASAPLRVTRLKWSYAAGVPMSAPAVAPDGTIVVGLTRTTGQILAVNPDGTRRWEATAGSGIITAPPAIGDHAIWVGSEDGVVYAVSTSGSQLVNVGVNTTGAIKGGLAIWTTAAKEWAFAGSANGYLGVASSIPSEYGRIGSLVKVAAPPLVGADGAVYAATDATSACVRSYRLDPLATILDARWVTGAGVNAPGPLAADASGNLWITFGDGNLTKIVPADAAAATTVVSSFSDGIPDSPLILGNGDLVLGDQVGVLHRVSASGSHLWSIEPTLGAAVSAGLALTGGSERFVVPTQEGRIFAVRDDGTITWSKSLAATALRAANIHSLSPTAAQSTAYFTGSNGTLYAVIVDGRLDAAAPWPKAFHDPRNTNRAGAQP